MSLTAVLSVVALLAAIWSTVESYKIRTIERRRDDRQEQRERQDQARAVATWMCVYPVDQNRKRWFVAVGNESTVPVYDAVVRIGSRFKQPQDLTIALVPPGRTYFELVNNDWEYGKQVDELGIDPRPLTQANVFKVTELTFTDSAGARWQRDDHGRISEAPPSPGGVSTRRTTVRSPSEQAGLELDVRRYGTQRDDEVAAG